MELPRYRSSRQVAAELEVHIGTLRRWEREGRIPLATRRNGLRVYSPTDVETIKRAVFAIPQRGEREGHE